MISIIVPVYKVEAYLSKCIESILTQTFDDFELLLIDDGSPDSCGEICEKYAGKDSRIQAIHIKNRGLSGARNYGIERASGDYLSFVDSDDWIESDMIENLYSVAVKTDADMVFCGYSKDFASKEITAPAKQQIWTGTESVKALIEGDIFPFAWGKLWKKSLIKDKRFPEGRRFEDVLTGYQWLEGATAAGCPGTGYHYIQRENSIVHEHDIANLLEFWDAHWERREHLKGRDPAMDQKLLLYCTQAAIRVWRWYYPLYGCATERIREIRQFMREHCPLFGCSGWPLMARVGAYFTHFDGKLAFWTFGQINKIYLRAVNRKTVGKTADDRAGKDA